MTVVMSTLTDGESLKTVSRFALFEGTLLILFGLAALLFPAFAGIAAAVLFGWLLLAVGIVGLVSSFGHGAKLSQAHFWWSLLSSVLAIIAGLLVAFQPFAGAMTLVVVIAAWLFLDGVASAMTALTSHRLGLPRWGWPILSAVIDWLLAGVLLVLSPVASLFAVGAIIGIDLLFGGVTLAGFGWSLRARESKRAA